MVIVLCGIYKYGSSCIECVGCSVVLQHTTYGGRMDSVGCDGRNQKPSRRYQNSNKKV